MTLWSEQRTFHSRLVKSTQADENGAPPFPILNDNEAWLDKVNGQILYEAKLEQF
jgi:hypothetical protein